MVSDFVASLDDRPDFVWVALRRIPRYVESAFYTLLRHPCQYSRQASGDPETAFREG